LSKYNKNVRLILIMGKRELLRVQAEIEVHFRSYDQFYQEYTSNLSKGGLFIKTKEPLPPQSVIEIKLFLPDEENPLSAVGEVVHIITPEFAEEKGWNPGMGVHLIDFEETVQKQLERYIHKRAQEQPWTIMERRRHPRAVIRMKVRFPDLTTLIENYAKDLSQGGIFIPTNDPKPVGTEIALTLIHPDTGEEIALQSEVVRVVTESEAHDKRDKRLVPGMGVKFINLSEAQQSALAKFLAVEYPVEPDQDQ